MRARTARPVSWAEYEQQSPQYWPSDRRRAETVEDLYLRRPSDPMASYSGSSPYSVASNDAYGSVHHHSTHQYYQRSRPLRAAEPVRHQIIRQSSSASFAPSPLALSPAISMSYSSQVSSTHTTLDDEDDVTPPPLPEKDGSFYSTLSTDRRPETPAADPEQPPESTLFRYQHVRAEDDEEAITILPLSGHLFQAGFTVGVFSDVTLHFLGSVTYPLHKLILCRAPFFHRMFLGSNANEELQKQKEIEIVVSDGNVTAEGIDLVLAYLYGASVDFYEEDQAENIPQHSITASNIIQVLCTALFFEVYELVDRCVDFIVTAHFSQHRFRHLVTEQFPQVKHVSAPTSMDQLLEYVIFVDSFEYGDAVTGRIEDSLLSYLCSEGYENLEELFVLLPLPWLSRVLEADAFWCPNEFARYQFIKNVVARRKFNVLKEPCDDGKNQQEEDDKVYETIFKSAIIYTHMTYEQLNEVQNDELVPEAVVMKSLWQQTRFRSTIEALNENHKGSFDTRTKLFRIPMLNASKQSASRQHSELVETSSENASPNKVSKPTQLAPVRIGLEFRGFKDLKPDERCYSETFFYAGNWWTAFIQRFPDEEDKKSDNEKDTMPEKWGVFLRRAEGKELTERARRRTSTEIHNQEPDDDEAAEEEEKDNGESDEPVVIVYDSLSRKPIQSSVSYYNDRRKAVRALFKIYNPVVKCYEPIFESKANDFAETQSWGYRSRENIVQTRDLINECLEDRIKISVVMTLV